MKIKLRTAFQVVCRECFLMNGSSLPHVVTSIDAFLDSFVCQSSFNAACGRGASLDYLEFLLSRTAPNWKEAMSSAAKGGHLHVLQWASEREDGRGAWTNDFDWVLDVAAANGHLHLIKWLFDRDIDRTKSLRRDEYSQDVKTALTNIAMAKAARYGHLKVVQWLYDTSHGNRQPNLLDGAIANGHLAVIQWVYTTNSQHSYRTFSVDQAARNGHLNVLQWLHENNRLEVSDVMMREAAENGHLEVVKWLHTTVEFYKPIKLAQVAENGHLEVLQWLWHNRDSSDDKILEFHSAAAANGHLEILAWLRQYFREGFTRATMNAAAANGHLDVVKWLYINCHRECAGRKRYRRCSKTTFQEAARNGHLEVLQWLHENHYKGFTVEVMDRAAENGHLEIVQWLHENRSEGCTEHALRLAIRNGHLEVMLYLLKHKAFAANLVASSGDVEIILDDKSSRRVFPDIMFEQHRDLLRNCLQSVAEVVFFKLNSISTLNWLSQFTIRLKSSTPIRNAVERGDLKFVRWFHRQGFDVCQPRNVRLALREGHLPLVVWFQDQGCDIEAPSWIENVEGCRNLPLMRWFIENRRTLDLSSAKTLALHWGHVEMVRWLSEDDRVQLVLDVLSSWRRARISDRRCFFLYNHHGRLLWWILANTQFERDDNQLAIRSGLLDASDAYDWITRHNYGVAVCSWLFPASTDTDSRLPEY